MAKVKVIQGFRDRTADLKLRKKGETLTVTEARAKKLEGLELAERIPEPIKKETEKTVAEKG